MEHYALCVAFYTKAQIAFIMAALLYEFLPETFLTMFSEVFHREEIDRQLFLLHDYSLVQVEMRRIFTLAEKQNRVSCELEMFSALIGSVILP